MIDPRLGRVFLIVIVDPSSLLVAFQTEGAPSHPHFAYEAETRQLTRTEPGCECYVLHSVNRPMHLMLLRVGCACGVRHCLHITQQPDHLLTRKPTLGRRAKSLVLPSHPASKLCPIISCRFDLPWTGQRPDGVLMAAHPPGIRVRG